MSVLKSLENKIAGLVEGTFSRAFRSEVRPVEIARKLAREMEEHKSFSVSRTYAPNEYRVFLSPRDRERFAGYEAALTAELAGYLLEHARRERLTLAVTAGDRVRDGRPARPGRVRHPDAGRATRRGAGRRAEREPSPAQSGPDDGLQQRRAGGRTARGARPGPGARRCCSCSTASGWWSGPRARRSGAAASATWCLNDPNVSRQHAEIRPRGGSWVHHRPRLDQRLAASTDAGSTAPRCCAPGDEIELGESVMTFTLE